MTLRIKPRAFASQTVRGFSYSLFLVFPSILPFPRGTLIHHSRPRKGRLAKSAVLARRVIESREKRGFARRCSSLYPLYDQGLVFGCVMRIRSLFATCAAQIHTALCGQYFSPIFVAVLFSERDRSRRARSFDSRVIESLVQYSLVLFI